MRLVGLTGGIGSGKSTVASLLAERGAEVIDADAIAREVLEPDTEGLAEVVERFGEDILDRDGRLVRERLAAIVFDDADARGDLNAIVHPRVRERIAARLAEVAEDPETGGDQIVVLDVPLLAEGDGSTEGYAAVIVVTAPEDVRIERLVRDRDMDPEDVRARIDAQASDEERRRIATHVVDNSGDLDALEREVEEVHADIAGGGGT